MARLAGGLCPANSPMFRKWRSQLGTRRQEEQAAKPGASAVVERLNRRRASQMSATSRAVPKADMKMAPAELRVIVTKQGARAAKLPRFTHHARRNCSDAGLARHSQVPPSSSRVVPPRRSMRQSRASRLANTSSPAVVHHRENGAQMPGSKHDDNNEIGYVSTCGSVVRTQTGDCGDFG